MLKVSTFCSGIGSPEVAIKNLGIEHEVVLTAEIDKYARQTYLANHSTKKMINDMTAPDYEGEEWYSDINVSGLPCQSFSLAGKRLGELDPRGLLFFDFYRYVKNQKPKYFIIENVKGLLSMDEGAVFQNWINLLGQSVNGDQFMFPHEDSLMYNLHWQVLNTKDYGLPQNRERVFLIGIRNDLPNSFVFPKGVPLKLRLKDILEDEVDEKFYLSDRVIENITGKSIKNYEGAIISNQGKTVDSLTDIASTLMARDYKGFGNQGMTGVIVQSATKSGYEIATEGDSINLEHPDSQTRRGRVGKQVAQTLTTRCNQGAMIGAMRGRTVKIAKIGRSEEGKKQRKESLAKGVDYTPFQAKEIKFEESDVMNCITTATTKDNLIQVSEYQQTLEINENGTSNCLTSVQKDNLVVETYNTPKVAHNLSGGKWDKMHEQSRRVYDENGIAPTIHTMGGGNQEIKTFDQYRIRKLTPREVFRLQGFSDEFLQNAIDAGVSNSQLYKQAGNSISVPVIQAILKNLLK